MDYASDSWLILPMENEVGKLTEKEMQKKYYFVDNGLLNLFLMHSETSLWRTWLRWSCAGGLAKRMCFS